MNEQWMYFDYVCGENDGDGVALLRHTLIDDRLVITTDA